MGSQTLPPPGGLAVPYRPRAFEELRPLGLTDGELEDAEDDKALGDFVYAYAAKSAAAAPPLLNALRHHAQPGLNAPKVEEYENDTRGKITYGDTNSILADVDSLGAMFFRQPSHADLAWPRDVVVPVCTDGTDLYNQVFVGTTAGAAMIADLVNLLSSLSTISPATKIVLTVFSGGSNNYNATDPSLEYNVPIAGHVQGVCRLDWDNGWSTGAYDPTTDHATVATETWWDGTSQVFGVSTLADAPAFGSTTKTYSPTTASSNPTTWSDDANWVYGSQDFRDNYKLKYIYYIGYAYGKVLLEVERQVGASWWEKILGVEVFNESNKASPLYNNGAPAAHYTNMLKSADTTIEAGARLWALAAREFVRGLQKAFTDAGSTVVLPLWLPSMAMYLDQGSHITAGSLPTFASVLHFQQKLCEYLVSFFTSDYSTTDASVPPVHFSWFQNQDYHYYNYRNNQAPGPILRLVAEMAALKLTFRDFGDGGTGVSSLAGHRVTLSVCENGAPSNQANIDTSIFKYMATLATTAERFQAREVWRRLATAAIGARYIGWHTHMSFLSTTANDVTGFSYLGLRDDSALSTTLPFASAINEKLSWWAYQLLASLTSTITAASHSGQILARWATARPATRDYYRGFSAYTGDIAYMGIVIHIMVAADDHYYLIMIDPCADVTLQKVCKLSTRSGRVVDFYQYPTIPTSNTFGTAVIPAYALPIGTPTWVAVSLLATAAHCTVPMTAGTWLTSDTDPILIRCSTVLDVEWVDHR